MNTRNDYKNKYLKYKIKYLELKNGGGLSKYVDMYKYGVNLIKNKKLNINDMIKYLPQTQQQFFIKLKNSGLLTSENTKILEKLYLNFSTHITDPNYYSIIKQVFEYMIELVSFVNFDKSKFINIIDQLNNLLIQLKNLYPEDFELLRSFFNKNKNQILGLIQKYYPSILNDDNYKVLVNFLS